MKEWPEYAYWHEDCYGETLLKHQLFYRISDYQKTFKPPDKYWAYRPCYGWKTPWMLITSSSVEATPLLIDQVPKDIRALHLLLS